MESRIQLSLMVNFSIDTGGWVSKNPLLSSVKTDQDSPSLMAILAGASGVLSTAVMLLPRALWDIEDRVP